MHQVIHIVQSERPIAAFADVIPCKFANAFDVFEVWHKAIAHALARRQQMSDESQAMIGNLEIFRTTGAHHDRLYNGVLDGFFY